jgi:hypothetical protein
VPVARGGAGLLSLVTDLGENADARLEITLRDILNQFGAQLVGGVENFIEDRLRATLKMDRLAATIFRGTTTFDPAVVLEAVEQSREGRAFNAHAFGDFFLSELISTLRKKHQGAPLSLAEAERAQTLIEPGSPGSGGPKEDKA